MKYKTHLQKINDLNYYLIKIKSIYVFMNKIRKSCYHFCKKEL